MDYLKRLKAWWHYKRLLRTMRNNWTVQQTSRVRCYYGALQRYTGDCIIVAEQNELGERRARCIQCPMTSNKMQHPHWGGYVCWTLEARPIMPPRKPVEVI